MTQFILGLNGALMAAQAGVVMLTSVDDEIKAIVVLGCSIAIAFINPWLPKVSEFMRRAMSLQRRG